MNHIQPNARILILGGGTGEILKNLDKQKKRMTIIYIEKSQKMINRACSNLPLEFLDITFVCADALKEEWPHCDVVITNFFLDVFKEENLITIMNKIGQSQQRNDIWICTEFVSPNTILKQVFIKCMYIFFRFTADLEGKTLINFEKQFHALNYRKTQSKSFFYDMIKSDVYNKEGENSRIPKI